MGRARQRVQVLCAALVAAGCAGGATDGAGAQGLEGTAWQLVRIQFIDPVELAPAERAKYTIRFQPDGYALLRIDCNRGRGPWRAGEAGALELGPLATTRVACPRGSHQDDVHRVLSEVSRYERRGSALVLRGDSGSLELEPLAP